MALGKRLFTGGTAACLTETTDIFGDSSGKALYSMDFDASSSGVYDGTPSNVDFGVGGYINTGARFNGSSSIITATQPSGINGPCSYSIWLKTTSSSYQSIITVGSISGSHTAGVNLFVNSGKLSCQTGNGSNTENNTLNSTSNVDTGNWVHCVVTVAGSTQGSAIKIYVNKTNETSGTANNTAIVTATGEKLCLGGRILSGSQSTFLNGSLDQARIFTKELNQQEINTLYAETACVHTSTTDNNDFPVTNAAYFKLDNSAEDSKGTNNGTESNIEYRFGRYGQAAVFNGSNSIISIPQPTLSGGFSLSAWFKTTSSGFQSIITMGGTNGVAAAGLNLFTNSGNVITSFGSGSAEGYTTNPSTAVNTGNWFHAVITTAGLSSGNTVNLYLNGVLVGTGTVPSGGINTTSYTSGFSIGGRNMGGSLSTYFNGYIDQVRIFASTLSAANVLKLAEEKPETDTSNFKTVLWEGTSANQFVSNVGMDLETNGGMVWLKNRDVAYDHMLLDSVRGLFHLYPNLTNTPDAAGGIYFRSFENNGFFVGSSPYVNASNNSYAGWVWKGGGAAVQNNDGSITSSVSANTAAGFSISKGTAPSSSGTFTVGHGLSSTPELVIYKTTDEVGSWITYTATTGASAYLTLNGNAAAVTGSAFFGNTAPTSSVYTLNSGVGLNTGKSFLGLCFHSVAGYQRISNYNGTGNNPGPIIYTTSDGTASGTDGFEPAWIMIKRTDSSGAWNIFDNKRNADNPRNTILQADKADQEYTNTAYNINFLTNGFQFLNTVNDWNASGGSYIFLAIK